MIAEAIRAIINNSLDQESIFKTIQDKTQEATNSLMRAIEITVSEESLKDFAKAEATEVCRQYQIDGYFKGINEGIKIANLLSGKQIQINDIITGQRIL